MPIIPSVFQPIRANDFQQRAIKTYKRYKVNSTNFSNAAGYFRHDAIFRKVTPHIFSDTGQGVDNQVFPINADDNTNKHVIWNGIDHKYYRNNNPAGAADFLDIELQKRFLWHSASIFTAPYGQVGEKIKHGTFKVTSSIGATTINLADDGNGNLYDVAIDSTTFASSSNNFFYMSANNLYQKFNSYDDIGSYTGNINYQLSHVDKLASINGEVTIVPGIETSGDMTEASGLAIQIPETAGTNIRIPHHDKFNRISNCNDWTISFWHKRTDTSGKSETILSKFAVTEEAYLDAVDGKRKTRTKELVGFTAGGDDIALTTPASLSGLRMPFHISSIDTGGAAVIYLFAASNGTDVLRISSGGFTTPRQWDHICVRNIGDEVKIFVNGGTGISPSSGELPINTINNADIIIGNTTSIRTDGGNNQQIAELRMYDYAISDAALTSLGHNHYLSAACYQTNVAGNVFYKNGQAVVSSPLPKYSSGSGVFGNTWNLEYRGTHTLYENECLVRVPKDQFNVTMNPSSTYRPSTAPGNPCAADQNNLPPGELRKGLFVSGTLKPYITSIGLYNDNAEMVAAAKLAQPIQKNPDVDMNFVVRWDY